MASTSQIESSSSSDEDSDRNGDWTTQDEDDFSNIVPFSFEPTYTEEEVHERMDMEDGTFNTPDDSDQSQWCSCGVCAFIPNEPNICCRSSVVAIDKMETTSCISETEDFRLVCLHKTILEAAFGNWHIFHGENLDFTNTNYRFVAYRQYIAWIHGRLGRNLRTPVPCCVLKAIRNTFPSADNEYVPFRQ